MKIALLSTDGNGGGAPRAMQRLAKGLSSRGHMVNIIQARRAHAQSNTIVVESDGSPVEGNDCATFIDSEYIYSRRTNLSNTYFSFQSKGYDLSQLIEDEGYDAINVHWSNLLLNPETAAPLIALGKPVVFTLHDMGHFTGGCHYSAGCEGFEGDCAPCPQLGDDDLAMARALILAKRRSYRQANVAAVAPSHWLADCASRSGVFTPGSVHRISNAIETDLFRPVDKAETRRALGLDPSRRYILFGVHFTHEARKGFDLLMKAIELLTVSPSLGDDPGTSGLGLLLFGENTPDIQSLGIPVTAFGFVGNDERLAAIYNAADLLVLPSLEDNQPNVMMEAMAAGVPVVAFAVGGMKDMIRDGVNGRLVPPGDVGALADAVLSLVMAPAEAAGMGQFARRDILAEAMLDRQAAQYEALFEALLGAGGARPSGDQSGFGARRDASLLPQFIHLPETVAPRVATTAVRMELERFRAARAAEEAQRALASAEAERRALETAARPRGMTARLAKLRRKISRSLQGVSRHP